MLKQKKRKIFCVGFNKTGTTSLKKALEIHDYIVGNQTNGELLIKDWAKRDFKRIIKLSKTADAFQDIPFSLPFSYTVLDQRFPNSKFILTVRDSPQEWYDSLVRFHSKLWTNDDMNLLTAQNLKRIDYVYPEWAYETIKFIYGTADDNLYDDKKLQEIYDRHNKDVAEYFKFKPEKLLIINLKDKSSYSKFCDFIEQKPILKGFPKLNSSK